MVDIDGVVSLFSAPGAAPGGAPGRARQSAGAEPVEGSFHTIDGILHFLSSTAAAHLLSLARFFDLVWASGWEEKADEYLPRLLGLPRQLPFLHFARGAGAGASTRAHWKLDAIERYAGARALAWIDDAFNAECHAWAQTRAAPTLLVSTSPERGLSSGEAELLLSWAQRLAEA